MNRESQVSSHFVLGQGGEITQLVPLERAAWTQGAQRGQPESVLYLHRVRGRLERDKGRADRQTVSGSGGADPVHRGGGQAYL